MSPPDPALPSTGRSAVGNVAVAADLPIAAAADELVAAIRDHQVVVVAGETGSGKSTQLPKLCLLAGRGADGLIGHTQPRRVAARSVAERVADELGTKVGGAVGYTVRFNDQVGPDTVIQVMTDGILLNEIQRDPTLARYDTLIIDEAHERSLNIDFILGFLRQLLPKRPELRLIITSATIDTERFAEHFAVDVDRDRASRGDRGRDRADGADGSNGPSPAPVFVVEGRTYPVELRYRPFGPDHDPADKRDQVTAVVDALDELFNTFGPEPGDVLVFLSGEREIRDTAQAVADHFGRGRKGGDPVDVLQLYSRLSAHEQHRIFEPHPGRRVVLATNIAETSITVPGVRAVVDTGTARISRYSKRLKVQRLPIEEISQASANQRSGRCGRVGPGIAIRLYSEDDFAERPEFTEPEILRTNLASVILQMTAIGLGDVARFPFVEPPDSSQIADGYRLLDELGAIKPGRIGAPRRLTGTGKKLARLPVDPRLGRMLIEAGSRHCVREVLVIASALSIQDVRERPADAPEKAAEFHNRFRVAGSDLLSIVALWDYLRERQAELSSSAFRRMCHAEYLHYLRVREWRDLYSQLRQVAGRLQLRLNSTDAHPDQVHKAVLAGLLSHIGERDRVANEYRGARDSRFSIARGSVLARKQPDWVMAAELVETNRLWARRVAAIESEWCEPLARHLAKRSYTDAFWQPDQGRAGTTETVTLYGRPIVSHRPVALDRIDPVLAREMFIRHVLVAGEWPNAAVPPPPVGDFVEYNRRFLGRVGLLEARVRRDDLYDDASLYGFYAERIPADVTDVASFEKWWIETRVDEPDRLNFTNAVLANTAGIRLADYPDRWRTSTGDYQITYRFDPDSPLDGVSIVVPVATLNQFDPTGLDWSIPGYRPDLIDELLRSLPKELRRELIPMTDTATMAAAYIAESSPLPNGSFVDALADAIEATRAVTVRPSLFRRNQLPTWLHTHLVIVDNDGAVIDAGDELAAIVQRQGGAARAAVAEVAAVEQQRGLTDWTFGDLGEVIERPTETGTVVRAFPTLVDSGSSVTLRVVDNAPLAERALRGGVHRLLMLNAAPSIERVRKTLAGPAQLAVAAAEVDIDELTADAIDAAVDAIVARGGLPRTEAEYRSVEKAVRAEAPTLAADALAAGADILAAAQRVHTQLMKMTPAALQPTRDDAAAQRDRLIAPGFIRRSGTARLPDVHRYLRGIEYRLDHLDGDVVRDQRRMAEVQPIEAAVRRGVAQQSAMTEALKDVVWMLEELRMATFAPTLGHTAPISAKRIRTAYQAATGEPLP